MRPEVVRASRRTTALALLLLLPTLGMPCATLGQKPEPVTAEQARFLRAVGGVALPNGDIDLGGVIIDRRRREVRVPAFLNMNAGIVEMVLCTPRGRAHESMFITWVDPFQIQLALVLLGVRNGARVEGGGVPRGALVDITADIWPCPLLPAPFQFKFLQRMPWLVNPLTPMVDIPVEEFAIDNATFHPMPRDGWVFVGSSFAPGGVCLASVEGNICNINSRDENTILDASDPDGNSSIVYVMDPLAPPPLGAMATLRIKPRSQRN